MLTNKDSVLLVAVLKAGMASAFCRAASQIMETGHSIFLGRGTAHEKWLQWLGVDEIKKELAIMIVPKVEEDAFYEMAANKFHLREKNTGIMVSIDVLRSFGLSEDDNFCTSVKKEGPMAYKAIFTIVEKGRAEDVMDVAEKAGARGGTIIHGRGAGAHEHEMLFNIQVEPEKDILMIITPNTHAKPIVEAIRKETKIDEPGNGVMFVLDCSQALGIIE